MKPEMHCPFCKGEVDVKSEATYPDIVGGSENVRYWVSCMKSGCPGYHRDHVGEHRTAQAAIDAWCVHDSVLIAKDRRIDGQYVTYCTLVGTVEKKYPFSHGNCFSMAASDGCEYRILNFHYENLKEAVRRGVELPVKILPVTASCALIADERIPSSWYSDRLCSVCTPEKFTGITGRVSEAIGIWCGYIEKSEHSIRYFNDKCPDLRTDEEKEEQGKVHLEWVMYEAPGIVQYCPSSRENYTEGDLHDGSQEVSE
jgi:hypothetical protein